MVATAGHPLFPIKISDTRQYGICKEQILERHSGPSTRYHRKKIYPPRLRFMFGSQSLKTIGQPGKSGPSLPTGDCPKLRPVGNLRSIRFFRVC